MQPITFGPLNSLKSISELVPLNVSGRDARKGFDYQDHVAAGLTLCFINESNLEEIWLETHEDIQLLWQIDGNIKVEFIQVKALDKKSRWSVSAICGSGDPTKSIVKKMLDHDRCKEITSFRIISSYDVDDDLAILKKEINSIERKSDEGKEKILSAAIIKKLGDIVSERGTNVHEWVKNCLWEKQADKLQDLINSNEIALELALKKIGKSILPDQRSEIYQRILSHCKNASSGDLKMGGTSYKLIKESFLEWLSSTIEDLYTNSPSSGTEKLEQKLETAKGVRADYIPSAKLLKWDYLKYRLNNDFIKSTDISPLETVLHEALFDLKMKLDNEEIDEDDFHQRCLERLEEIRVSQFQGKNISPVIVKGYMYDLTSKCLHRFRRVLS